MSEQRKADLCIACGAYWRPCCGKDQDSAVLSLLGDPLKDAKSTLTVGMIGEAARALRDGAVSERAIPGPPRPPKRGWRGYA